MDRILWHVKLAACLLNTQWLSASGNSARCKLLPYILKYMFISQITKSKHPAISYKLWISQILGRYYRGATWYCCSEKFHSMCTGFTCALPFNLSQTGVAAKECNLLTFCRLLLPSHPEAGLPWLRIAMPQNGNLWHTSFSLSTNTGWHCLQTCSKNVGGVCVYNTYNSRPHLHLSGASWHPRIALKASLWEDLPYTCV